MSFKKIIEYEKKNMNPIRRKINHVIVPIFLIFMVIILTVVGITMSIDEKKYTPLAIILFSVYGLMCILLVATVPLVRKKEMEIELGKYNFSKVDLEDLSEYEVITMFDDKEEIVIFKENKLELYKEEYYYNDFDVRLYMSNHLNKINLLMVFTLLNTNLEYNSYLTFKVESRLIAIIDKLNIQIQNRDDLDYIISNKEEAFKQIYTYGYIKKKNL